METKNKESRIKILSGVASKMEEVLGRKPNDLEQFIGINFYTKDLNYKYFIQRLLASGKELLPESYQQHVESLELVEGDTCIFDIHTMNSQDLKYSFTHPVQIIQNQAAKPLLQVNTFFANDIESKRILQQIDRVSPRKNGANSPITTKTRLFFDQQFVQADNCHVLMAGVVSTTNFVSTLIEKSGGVLYFADLTQASNENISQLFDPQIIQAARVIGNIGLLKTALAMLGSENIAFSMDLDAIIGASSAKEILQQDLSHGCLIAVQKTKEAKLKKLCKSQDIPCTKIGEITEGSTFTLQWNKETVAELPLEILNPTLVFPVFDAKEEIPEYIIKNKQFDLNTIPDLDIVDLKDVAKQMVTLPNIVSRRWIPQTTVNADFNRYTDATVVPVEGPERFLAISVGCNQRYTYGSPETGTAIAVAEAARNIVCSGGIPLVVLPMLKIGNISQTINYRQMLQSIRGLERACQLLHLPIVGGNVNFDTISQNVSAMPTVGVVGTIVDQNMLTSYEFKRKGDTIYVIGMTRNDLAASEYLQQIHKVKHYPAPHFEEEEELSVQALTQGLINEGLIMSAHSVSAGGLFVNLIESCLPNNLGFTIETDSEVRPDVFLFGESQSRVVVTVKAKEEKEFLNFMEISKAPVLLLGHVTRGKIVIDNESFGDISDYKQLMEVFNPVNKK